MVIDTEASHTDYKLSGGLGETWSGSYPIHLRNKKRKKETLRKRHTRNTKCHKLDSEILFKHNR